MAWQPDHLTVRVTDNGHGMRPGARISGNPGHGRSHVLPAFIAPYASVPVLGGRLALGTWQSIALVDVNVDNPDRQVRLSFPLADPPLTLVPPA